MSSSGNPDPVDCAVVADDDPEMRSLVSAVLRGFSLRVVEAENGRVLLERVRALRDPLALVVTDLQMPEVTGLRALRQMRRMGVEAPVVLITAFGGDHVHDEALRAGAAFVLDKPFSLVAFRERVADLLGDESRRSGTVLTRVPGEEEDEQSVG